MKRLMIVLSLVFVASCGKGKLSSCGFETTFDATATGSECVESSNDTAVKTQKDGLESGETQCTHAQGTGDAAKDYTCVKAGTTETTSTTSST